MSKITVGKIITRRDDTRRDLIWESIRPLRWSGYDRGIYRVEVEPGLELRLDVGSHDLEVIAQLDGLLDRLIEQNHDGMIEMAESDAYDELLSVAWFALNPVRLVGYGDGEYSIKVPGGQVLKYSVTRFEAMLLHRFDDILDRFGRENPVVLEQLLAIFSEEQTNLEAA